MTDDPRHSELASFGEELRREREIRGISLKEIADSTKVSRRFLEAIERNDHKTLPAPVFTRGFVRQYANYLGLNAEEVVNRYNFAAAGDDRIEKSAHLERLTTPQTPPPPPKKRGIPRARVDGNIAIIALIVVALAGVSWWAMNRKRVEGERARAADSTAVAAPAPAHTAAAATTPPPAATAAPVSAPTEVLRLTMDITAKSWVVLEADGKTVINDELHRGDHKTFEAKDGFRFRTIGNAAGVSLMLNNVQVPPLGDDGEVLHDKVFNRTTLQQLAEATPDHT